MIDGALAWISWIAQWVGQFIPKWEVLDPTLGWVKFRRGRLHSSGRGGIVVWWPILTKVEVVSVAEQTLSNPSPSRPRTAKTSRSGASLSTSTPTSS